ncbi:MAG: hypothetical protein MUO41_09765 [Methyloceanibacter sp.]|nr:hypothetical protein [Methyloceanibacter sp.]
MSHSEQADSNLPAEAQAVRESEEKYRRLFENLHDAAFLADAETGCLLEVNRQAETNLHNVHELLNHQPRAVLQIGIFIGGLLVPLVAGFFPIVRQNRWSLFLPAAALVPTALGWFFFRGVSQLNKSYGHALVQRPSESVETFMYLFLLFYLIVFARRINELEAEKR